MKPLLSEIRKNPLLWLLVFVPVVFVASRLAPEAATLLFVLSVLAIVPLAALLSRPAQRHPGQPDRTGHRARRPARGAVHAGEGLDRRRDRRQHPVHARGVVPARRAQAPRLLFLATVALLVPSAIASADSPEMTAMTGPLSVGLAVLLIAAYGLGLLFSLKTHRDFFASAAHGDDAGTPWPMGLALATLAGVTVLVALVSEIFVESVQGAALEIGMTPAFVGFVVVALVGGAAEMASAFSGARKNRLDLSVGIALGSASQIALFVAPVLVLLSYVLGPSPMGLQFWPGAVVMMLIATMTATMLTSGGRSAWFVGVLLLMVYTVFAMTLYLLPPRTM